MKLIERIYQYSDVLKILTILALYSIVFLFIFQSGVVHEIIVNILASVFLLFVSIFFIDSITDRVRESKWNNVKSVVISEINDIAGDIISSYIVFFNYTTTSFTGIDKFRTMQSEIFKQKVIPSLNKRYMPSIFHYSTLYKYTSKVQRDFTILFSSYTNLMHPDIIPPLIYLKNMINILNNELMSLDFSNPGNNSTAQYEIIDTFLAMIKDYLVTMLTELHMHADLKNVELYDLT